jgi:hypothetical protein
MAWNLCLFPSPRREEQLQELAKSIPPDVRPMAIQIVTQLIQRKLTHFPDNKRAILSYEVTMTANGPHVQVMSSLDPG